MSERKAKQAAFEAARLAKVAAADTDFKTAITNDGELTVYTYGLSKHTTCPVETEKDFDASKININVDDFKDATGMDVDLMNLITATPRFRSFISKIASTVVNNKLKVICIHCLHGRHRSVAAGNILKNVYFPKAKVIHLEINKQY
jgi:RNase adaptor protein for sRNA GlmZ degradation